MLKFFVIFTAFLIVSGAKLENIDDSPSSRHKILCDLNSFICKCGDIDVVTCKCNEWSRDCPVNFVYDEEDCECKEETENVVDHRNFEDTNKNQHEKDLKVIENLAFQFNDANSETQDTPAEDSDFSDLKFPQKPKLNDKIMNRGRRPPDLIKKHEQFTSKSIETSTKFPKTSVSNQEQSQEAYLNINSLESSEISKEHLGIHSRSSKSMTGFYEHSSHSGASESIEKSLESSKNSNFLGSSNNLETVKNIFASWKRLDSFEDNPHPLDKNPDSYLTSLDSQSSSTDFFRSGGSESLEKLQDKDDSADTNDSLQTSSPESTTTSHHKSSNKPSSGHLNYPSDFNSDLFPSDAPSVHLIHPKPSLVSDSSGLSNSLVSESDFQVFESTSPISGSDQSKDYGSEESTNKNSEPSTESELHSNSIHSRHPMSSHGLIEMPSNYGSHTTRKKHDLSPSKEESSLEAVSSDEKSTSMSWMSFLPNGDSSESSKSHFSSEYASEADMSSTAASDGDVSLFDLSSTSFQPSDLLLTPSDVDLTTDLTTSILDPTTSDFTPSELDSNTSDLVLTSFELHLTSSNLISLELDHTASEEDFLSSDKDLTSSELDSSTLDVDSTEPDLNSTFIPFHTSTYSLTSTSTSSNESCHIPECRPCDEFDQVNCICYQVEMECLPGYTTSNDGCECVRDNTTSISDVCPGLICTDGLSVNEAFCNCSHKICSSMEPCEDKFLLDLETCECTCGLREWNCQKSFVINKEKCTCEPPPCTPFFPCPNGTHWDYDACTCACSNPPSCRSNKYEVEAHSCKCVCVNKECDDGFIVDQLTCECVPEHEPECPPKFVYDPMLCRCICQAFNECPYNFQWDESLCKCVCPKSVVCGDDFIWSDQHCDCICNANKTCQSNFIFDHQKCDCICDSKLNDDGCGVGHIFDRRICECVKGVRPQCPAGFVYSEEQCDCVCAVVEKCTGKGIFDHDTCKCVCLEEHIECDFGIFEKEECDCVSGLPIDFFGGNFDRD